MNNYLIKNAKIVSSKSIDDADILISNGRIEKIAQGLHPGNAEIIEAGGLFALPGVTDPQVHFRDPGLTHKEDLRTGSRAAAAGGVTSFYEMPNTIPATTTRALMAEKKKIASDKCIVNYNFFIGATPNNLEELNSVENVTGIKIFMGSSTGDLLVSNEKDLDRIFGTGSKLIAVHSEDDEVINRNKKLFAKSVNFDDHRKIRSSEAAMKSTQLAVRLSLKYRRRLHILHLTTQEEAEFLNEFRNSSTISSEVCPQHLLLNGPDIYDKFGALAQMNPPIRSERHSKALWKALREGVIKCIATDHAPHTLEEKSVPFGKAPSGMPGVETSLPLMLNEVNKGNCSLQEVVKWMCENPVLLYRAQNKGFIKEGFDADITLVDNKLTKIVDNKKLQTKSGWCVYEGMKITGWPVMTIVNGNIVYHEGIIYEDIKGKEVLINEF